MLNVPSMEDFKALEKKLDELKALLMLADVSMPKVVTVADICRMESISKTQISTKEVYLLPNFGISEYPDGKKRWNLDTYMQWRAIPANQRKDMYFTYLENLRRAEVGISRKAI